MSNLTDAAQVTRVGVKVVIGVLIALVVGKVIFDVTVQYINSNKKPDPPQLSVGFGPIPKIRFPEKSVGKLTFKLETIGNAVPTWGPGAKVYLIEKAEPAFLDLDNAKKQAAALGFKLDPAFLGDNNYQWQRFDPLPATLDMNIVTKKFSMNVAWETDPTFLTDKTVPSLDRAIIDGIGYLKRGGFLSSDISEDNSKAKYMIYSGGIFEETISQRDANFVQVALFRKDIKTPARLPFVIGRSLDDAPIMPPDPQKGMATLLISGHSDATRKFVGLEFAYTKVDYDIYHSYPVITGPEAWNRLINGKGYIATPPSRGSDVVIRKISFGYYDPLDAQRLLQPIYIFEGDYDFVAYVPAVTDEWYRPDPTTTPAAN